jgi:hypothetical protein
MNRVLPLSGVLAVTMGTAWMFPAFAQWSERGALQANGQAVVALGLLFILAGAAALWRGFRKLALASIPVPVRIAIVCNILFLSFCALELSDGLVRQGGRVFYWTSVLFLPALVLLYGQVLAHRWAWWVARTATALFAVWSLGFIVMIPMAGLRSGGAAIPWQGMIYVGSVSLAFAGLSAWTFRSLGNVQARKYFRLSRKTS